MARTVSIGNQDFESIRKGDYFYIDKTSLIREWWEQGDSVTLIVRPRRFGKTLNMSMLEKFFSLEYADRGDLFEGLEIWKEEKYRALQGTFPVIMVSFAGVKEDSFVNARKKICQLITNLYNKYDFLLKGEVLNTSEKDVFQKVSAEMEDYIASDSLKNMSEYLFRYYRKKVILLLDEYDTPMQEAYVSGYWEELVSFIRNLFNASFKTNAYLERAMMTGITRISKESIFSDLNNLEVVTTTSEKYQEAFGFTQKEVLEALEEYGLSESAEEVKYWYDGFTFGEKTDIYNPWSIINYLDKRRFSTYWANTSSNSLTGKLIREGSREVKLTMEDLLRGRTFHTQIDEQIVFERLGRTESAIWSLFLASGYLKAENHRLERGKAEYDLALTNQEVHIMFEQMIGDWFAQSASDYNDFVKALLRGDKKSMNAYMNRVALSVFSYFDTGNKPSEQAEPERFYHGFVLGLMVDLEGRYRISSNRESGYGRYDVMLEPCGSGEQLSKRYENSGGLTGYPEQTAGGHDDYIIMEFKVHDPEEEDTLEATAMEALAQIDRMKYASALEARGIPADRIRKYGFAFQGKRVLIEGSAEIY